jgi:tRNA A-37 threonylcarbamoyl transferase component Bud32
MFADLFRKLALLARPSDLPVVRGRGRVWHVTPAGAEVFGPGGPDLERWVATGAAVVVKANPARTVYRVELPAGTVFVKHCRVTGPRALGREVIRPPKARLEFDNARALRARGIAAVEPLAWGGPDSRWPGESFLVTRGLAGVPFQHYLEHALPALPPGDRRAARRQLAVAFGEFLAKLHDAGVAHPDPHPGNLLVEAPPGRPPHFALIDLHAVRLGPPLSWAASRANLVLFNRWFQLRASRADRARFWRAYRRARVSRPIDAGRATELERDTHASNLRFWAGREGRCLGTNRHFRRVTAGPFRGFAVRDLPDAFLRQLLANPDATLAAGRPLKAGRTSTVVVIDLPAAGGPVPVVLKRVDVRGRFDPLKNLVRRSQVLRSWVSGHALRDRWLPTPRPLAAFHRYRRGLPCEGYLLTELVPEAADPFRRDAKRGALALARTLRRMHDRGVSHRDLKAANVLFANGTDPTLIDLVGVRTGVRLSAARRAKELARLNASFLNMPGVSRTDRLRFLRAYLAAGPALAGWKTWWEMVSAATAAKVAKNRRTGRPLG